MKTFREFAVTAQEIPMSRQDFESMAQRVYNIYKNEFREEGFLTWKQWIDGNDPYELSLSIESDYHIYDRFLRDLPEDITAIDIIKAYKEGRLKDTPFKTIPQLSQIKISSTGTMPSLPWSGPTKKQPESSELKRIFSIANQKIIKSNKEQVTDARKNIFIFYNSDPALAEKLGVSKTILTQRIRAYSGFTANAHTTQMLLNRDVPEEHQWHGISNSSFLGRIDFKHEDVDRFVKNIDVSKAGAFFYGGDRGQAMRNYIARVFMSINTGLVYHDLSFKIGKIEPKEDKTTPPRGIFDPTNLTVTISDLNPNTVAHEIGHYLDHKFGGEIGTGGLTNYDTGLANNPYWSKEFPLERLQWADKYNNFIRGLMDRGDISSEYTQRPSETFARFINFFVGWACKKAGAWGWDDSGYQDRFSEQDCKVWVRLLQEKSYIDAKYPIKLK